MANIKCPVEINAEMLSIRDFLHVKDGKNSVFTLLCTVAVVHACCTVGPV